MQAVTLEVILRAVFGVTRPGAARAAARAARRGCSARSPRRGCSSGCCSRARFGRDDPLEELRREPATVDEVLLRRDRRAPRRPGASASATTSSRCWSATRFADGEGMSDAELRDQLITLLLAGHETTATALAWTFDLLLRNPASAGPPARRARRGRRRLPARGDQRGAAAAAGGPARRAAAGRRAARRRAPAAGGHRRHARRSGSPTRARTSTRSPLEFRPERFLDDPPETYAWVPFGGGVRRCLGAAFAEFEMRIVLRQVLDALRAARRTPGAGADRAPQHHLLAAARDAGHRRRPPARAQARACGC